MADISIAWWNLENLFDTVDSSDRPEWLRKNLAEELVGWTREILEQKLSNLAAMISLMNDKRGPDIIGVCEVENKTVLRNLVAHLSPLERNYDIIHHSCNDARGIDIAFVFDADFFSVKDLFTYDLIKRRATRDIVQVTFTIKETGVEFIVIGNHWPSRSGGELESEPYRIVAAETLAYWLERIPNHKGAIPVIIMGDFNDNPFDRSLMSYALGCSGIERVKRAKTNRLLNLMWPAMGQSKGSFYYNGEPLLFDQFLVNQRFLAEDSPIGVNPESMSILTPKLLGLPVRSTRPRPFGRPSQKVNPKGWSDHFPISMTLFERRAH